MQTIWALGWSMIVLAALVHLPLRAIGTFALAMIRCTTRSMAFTSPTALRGSRSAAPATCLIRLLHVSGPIVLGGPNGIFVFALYPLIPWIGVMAAGYVFGKLYDLDAATRRRGAHPTRRRGRGAVRRASRDEPLRRPEQVVGAAERLFTVLSFLNTTKYPPSLLYLCMTIGPGILLLAFMERDATKRAWKGAGHVRPRADAVLHAAVAVRARRGVHRLEHRQE